MLDYIATDRCRMRFLREQLDDPGAEDCGRCDSCGGLTLSAARLRRRGRGGGRSAGPSRRGGRVPRKMWPTALGNLGVDLKGKIAGPPRRGAVARLTDLGHGNALRELRRRHPGRPVLVPLVKAVIEVLGDWRPPVDGIVVVESVTWPTLTADLADGPSRYLRVPVIGPVGVVDPRRRPRPGRCQLRPARRRGRPSVRAADLRVVTAGQRPAAGRRPGRHRLDLTLAARALRAAVAPPRCARWCSAPSPEPGATEAAAWFHAARRHRHVPKAFHCGSCDATIA